MLNIRNYKSDKSNHGFTIVELLVVIVVIAILATITIVSYDGINQRAQNSQIISGVEQYYKAIKLYRTLNEKYPPTSEEQAGNITVTLTCLGTGYVNQECGLVTGRVINEDQVFNDAMQKVIGSAPAIGEIGVIVQGETFTGAVYGGDVVNCDKSPTCYARTIQYGLKGKDQDCVLHGAYAYNVSDDTTACEIILEPLPQP